MPLALFRRIIHLKGFVYYTLHPSQAAGIALSIHRRLGGSENAFEGIRIVKAFAGLFDHYFEKLVTAYYPLDKLTEHLVEHAEMRNRALVEQAVLSDRGGIFLTGHFGAVEYIPVFFALNRLRPSIVLRFKTKNLRAALLRRARKLDIELIDADEGNVAFRALKAVRSGRILITLCDEFKHWRPSRDRRISILGCKAPSDRTLDILYQRSKAPVFIGFMERNRSRVSLKVRTIADGGESISITEEACKILSKAIADRPEQWYQWRAFETEFRSYAEKANAHAAV